MLEIWEGNQLLDRFPIDEGTLYSMEGQFQELLRHSIAQKTGDVGTRFSITFRHLIPNSNRKKRKKSNKPTVRARRARGAGRGSKAAGRGSSKAAGRGSGIRE